MPKQQSSLDSFFGTGGKKKKNPQTKLDSFFGKKNNDGDTTEKENNKRSIESGKKDDKRRKRVIDDSDEEKMEDIHSQSPKKMKNECKKNSEDADQKRESSKDDEEMEDIHAQPLKKDVSLEKEGKGKAEDVKNGNPGDKDDDNKDKKDDEKKAKAAGTESMKIDEEVKKTKPSSDEAVSAATQKKAAAKSSSTSAAGVSSESHLPYGDLCDAFESIEKTTKRLEIQEIVTNMFRQQIDSGLASHCTNDRQPLPLKVSENLKTLMFLMSSEVAPAFECVELGIGDALLIKAIADASGSNTKAVKGSYEDQGDLGLVAQKFKGKQKTLGGFFVTKKAAKKKVWTCQQILASFRDIANMKGGQSQKLKTDKIKKLLVGSTHALEPKFIIRALQGKLRIGLAESTVLISLAHAVCLSPPPTVSKDENDESKEDYPEEVHRYLDKTLPKEKHLEAAVAIVKKAYASRPSYDALIDAVLANPLEKLHQVCTLKPGMPVQPMLAKPTKSISEVLKRLNGQRFTAEYKYDGERAQVHIMPGGSTAVFSRNLLNTSEKFPEVSDFVKEAASDSVESCVLDTEVVAYDSKQDKLVPFQILSTRKKTEESAETAKVQVIVQAFDLMYLNGDSLLGRSLEERRVLLRKHFSVVEGKFQFAISLDYEENGDTLALEQFLDRAVKGQCEGLMVKTLDLNANYEPSKRSLNWLKLKKDYLEGMGDSVDLVPIGAYHGKGKRTGVYGAYLLACFDPDTEEFQSVCKIGTGFSDEDLKSLAASLNDHIIPKKASEYDVNLSQLECDVWFDSVQVWEVKAADLSKSSAHRGAVGKTGEEGRGIGLRFPRFERVRDDKRPCDATTSHQILDLYYNQDSVQGGGGTGEDDYDDDDGI